MILRESKDISFEAPFIYLFLGRKKAMLIDTGATQNRRKFPLRDYVEKELEKWLNSNPYRDYSVIVAHTHSHGDHVAGDLQFEGKPGTVVVGKQVGQVLSFFGISGASGNVGQVDLGGRIIEVTHVPGHHPASVAFYDSQTGFLVTGDTVYPGRLYARDYPAFVDSLNRLVDFAKSRKVSYVLGAHVEMTDTPRKEYPIGARYQPNEHRLEMSMNDLVNVRNAATSLVNRPGPHMFDDFAIYHGSCYRALLSGLFRGMATNLVTRFR
jgi:glyoxylase-like metal-dependent hydrolase (beta-lactamase superfamily II)